MSLPQFIGIGAPRSGTRWLAQCLAEHPEISLPSDEVYFFTTRRVVHSYWHRGLEWYEKIISTNPKPGAKIFGEITPVYLLDDDTPHLIRQTLPDVKLICLLRDQSERAYSWYRFFLRVNPEIFDTNYSFRHFLTYQTEVYGQEGFYLEHIERYLRVFDRESLLVLLYDDIEARPLPLIRCVYSFLGVNPTFAPPSAGVRINEATVATVRSRFVRRISSKLAALPALRRLSGTLNAINLKRVGRENLPRRHRLDPEMRERMRELYADHNERLGRFLKRDLSHWNTGTLAHPIVQNPI